MDKLKEATLLLRRAGWTRNVSGEALNGMLEHATFKSYSRKSLIFRLGAPSSTFYGALSGQVCLSIQWLPLKQIALECAQPGYVVSTNE